MLIIDIANIGLELYELDQAYRKRVLAYLQAVRKSEDNLYGLLRLNKLFRVSTGSKNRKGPKDPKDSKKLQNWRGEYPFLTKFMKSTTTSIEKILIHGENTRDAFVTAGLLVMEDAAQQVAQDGEITIQDIFSNEVLVERSFLSKADLEKRKRQLEGREGLLEGGSNDLAALADIEMS